MFQIYKGGTTFKQWSKGNKLIMDVLPVGADVLFYNETYSDSPIKSDVYEITNEDDEIIKVCDVPSALLTEAGKIKVCVRSIVTGKYGVNHSMVGSREKFFEVESAEKPSDYVEDVVDPIDPKCLPEGVPYAQTTEVTLVKDVTTKVNNSTYIVDGAGAAIKIELGKKYRVIVDGVEYVCPAVDGSTPGKKNKYFISDNGKYVSNVFVISYEQTNFGGIWYDPTCHVSTPDHSVPHTVSLYEIVEDVQKIDPRCLPGGVSV